MKSEFLTLWDGMLSDAKDSPPITVIGATNRPYDVDSAILRRLPRTFEIGLPNLKSRLQILNLFLAKHNLTEEAKSFIPTVAKMAEGYSGSDLKELCRAAAMVPVREITQEASRNAVMGSNKSRKKSEFGPPKGTKMRAVSVSDFKEALRKVRKTGETAKAFLATDESSGRNNDIAIDANSLAQTFQFLMNRNMSDVGNNDNEDIPNIN